MPNQSSHETKNLFIDPNMYDLYSVEFKPSLFQHEAITSAPETNLNDTPINKSLALVNDNYAKKRKQESPPKQKKKKNKQSPKKQVPVPGMTRRELRRASAQQRNTPVTRSATSAQLHAPVTRSITTAQTILPRSSSPVAVPSVAKYKAGVNASYAQIPTNPQYRPKPANAFSNQPQHQRQYHPNQQFPYSQQQTLPYQAINPSAPLNFNFGNAQHNDKVFQFNTVAASTTSASNASNAFQSYQPRYHGKSHVNANTRYFPPNAQTSATGQTAAGQTGQAKSHADVYSNFTTYTRPVTNQPVTDQSRSSGVKRIERDASGGSSNVSDETRKIKSYDDC